MNEETKDLIEQLNVCSVNDYNFEIYGNEAKMLNEHITNLQNRIDKAIEFIKMFDIEHLHEICEHNLVETLEALLDILKESGE